MASLGHENTIFYLIRTTQCCCYLNPCQEYILFSYLCWLYCWFSAPTHFQALLRVWYLIDQWYCVIYRNQDIRPLICSHNTFLIIHRVISFTSIEAKRFEQTLVTSLRHDRGQIYWNLKSDKFILSTQLIKYIYKCIRIS